MCDVSSTGFRACPSRIGGSTVGGRGRSGLAPWSDQGYETVTNDSQDQHRIAERVEAVALSDCLLVEVADDLDAREGHDEREQGRARQVEVRQEVIDAPELEARRDE